MTDQAACDRCGRKLGYAARHVKGATRSIDLCETCVEQLAELARAAVQRAEPRPPAVDADARSDRPDVPAYASPPADAPPYHGFPVLGDVQVEGFTWGVITDFEAAEESRGDAFVVAPDGARAGLIWRVGRAAAFEQAGPIEQDRWGVWAATFTNPLRTRDDARRHLAEIVPQLREAWARWRRGEYDPAPPPIEAGDPIADLEAVLDSGPPEEAA